MKYATAPPTSPSTVWGTAEPPLHVVVASGEERLQWTVLESFATHPRARVTACSTVGQCRQLCAADPPGLVILDLALLDEEPSALSCFASLIRPDTRIIGLTCRSTAAAGKPTGGTGPSLIPKPVAPEHLVRAARSGRTHGAPPPD